MDTLENPDMKTIRPRGSSPSTASGVSEMWGWDGAYAEAIVAVIRMAP
jgi:hypothetical protein